MIVKGVNGQVDFDGETLKIARKGGVAALTHTLQGERVIPISQVISVQFKDATRLTNGYIHFATASTTAINSLAFVAADPNTVIFKLAQEDEFAQLRQEATDAAEKNRSAGGSTVIESPLDALKKLKELFDNGVISEEEYIGKKALLMDKI